MKYTQILIVVFLTVLTNTGGNADSTIWRGGR